jgi:hypothetical protein
MSSLEGDVFVPRVNFSTTQITNNMNIETHQVHSTY